jgi:putative hydrolase of the HAD superfamily
VTRWRAVIFDLDDTLYPERDYVLSGFRAVADWAERRGFDSADSAFASLESMFSSGVRGDTFDRWLESKGLPKLLSAEMVAAYRAHTPRLSPFPQIVPLLESLRGRAKLGLVSDGYLAVQRAKFAALGLAEHFSAVVFSDELGRDCWKPSPRPFERVLDLLDERPSAAVYVADNCAKDFLGARRAGLSTIWVKYSEGDYCRNDPPTADHAAEQVVRSVAELTTLLLRGAEAEAAT